MSDAVIVSIGRTPIGRAVKGSLIDQAGAPASITASAQAEASAARKLSPSSILGVRETAGALRFLGQVAMRHPQAMLRTAPGLGQELVKISLGRSQVAPEKGDKRFADSAWQQNSLFRATMQSYLTWGSGLDRYVDNLGLTGKNIDRMRFGLLLLREAMAPTNFFAANPAAVKRCYDTGGKSVRRGLANWVGDLRHNHGMPSMVDRRPFTIGENLAATPGSVIYRNEVFELMQYAPQTGTVFDRPLLVVPPQVNKYYALDLAPGLRHPGLERGHHPAVQRLPPPANGHGRGEPDGAPGSHDGPGHAGRRVPHRVRHVRSGRADRPHHTVADLLSDHPARQTVSTRALVNFRLPQRERAPGEAVRRRSGSTSSVATREIRVTALGSPFRAKMGYAACGE